MGMRFHMDVPCSLSFAAKYLSKNSFTGADASFFGLSLPRSDSASKLPRFCSSSRLLWSARCESDSAMHCNVHSDRSAHENTSDLVVIVSCWLVDLSNLLDLGDAPPFYIVACPPGTIRKKMASIITRLLSTTLQEEIDLWRLYHMVHYFELCEGKNVKVPKPPKSSLRQQRKRVEACITTQVAVRHCRHLACVLG